MKSHLHTELFSLDQRCYNYNYLGNRKVNAILASQRTKCSVLKYDLYKNNIVNSALCECGSSDETYFHYFVKCKLYTVIRDTIFKETSFITLLNVHKTIHGSRELTKDQNIILHCAVSRFILSSNRF